MLLGEKQKGHPVRVGWYSCLGAENRFGKCQRNLQLDLLPMSESTVIVGMEEHTRGRKGSRTDSNRSRQESSPRPSSTNSLSLVLHNGSITGNH